MSFSIVLQRNTSPVNKLTKDLVTLTELTGTLRKGSSILDPVIELDVPVPSNIVSTANYAHIEEFGRYYFITDIRSTVNGLWLVSLHVDVLMTYRTQIKAQSGIVNRSANKYNLYLDDGWFVDYQNPHIIVKPFPNTRAFEHQEYVLVLAGNTGAVNNTESEVTDNGTTE